MHNDDGNPLVDDLFYYANVHDVWNAHVDADAHYNSFRLAREARPERVLQHPIYLSANPDVAANGINPLTHFHQIGWIEGRVRSLNFDVRVPAANPDVAAAHIDPLAHFLARRGRRTPAVPGGQLPAPNGFDYVYYMQHNPDATQCRNLAEMGTSWMSPGPDYRLGLHRDYTVKLEGGFP